eukprot:m51a1_g2419 putative abc transporter-related protein (703) ;mRNA; r:805103-807613
MAIKDALLEGLGDARAKVIGDEIVDYIVSVVESDNSPADDLCELCTPFLITDGCMKTREEVLELCERLVEVKNPSKVKPRGTTLQKLVKPVTMSQSNFKDDWADYLAKSENPTYVDQEALRKAEEKKQERLEKKAAREALKAERQRQKEGIAGLAFNPSGVMSGGGEGEGDDGTGTSPDIRAENICLAYGKNVLLENATLMVAHERRYGLVGRNGCGKSTLLRHIARREIVFSSKISVLHVEQEVTGNDTTALDAVLAADVERINLLAEEKRLVDIGASVDEGSRLQAIYRRLNEIDAYGAEGRASAILTGLSFTEEMKKMPTKSFSGGWRMRIALARALFCSPDLLLLDEPTNHLDFHAIIWLERFLTQWKKTLVIVSHQRDFLNNVATDIIHVYNHQLNYYRGNYDAFERVANERIRAMKSEYEAQQAQRAHVQKFIDRFRYNAKRASLVQSRIKMMQKMDVVGAVVEEGAVALPFPDPDPIPPPVVQFVDVSFGFTPEKPIFEHLSLTFDLDSRVALVGPNGCGKTTFLKLLVGELEPSCGHVIRNGKLRFAMFSQHFVDQLDLDMSAVEYLKTKYPAQTPTDLRAHLGKYGITGDTALQTMRTLSGGQKSRVVFALIAHRHPHVLLLDEPSNHLDIETIEGLAQSLTAFQGGVLMVSHDQRLISMVCDETWHIHDDTVTRWDGDIASYKRYLQQSIPV